MMLIEIEGIGNHDGYYYHVDNGLQPFLADAEYVKRDQDDCLNIRKMQFLFNRDFSNLDEKLHRFVSFHIIAFFPQYSEITVRYKKKKNA
jgi:hypothetical protein